MCGWDADVYLVCVTNCTLDSSSSSLRARFLDGVSVLVLLFDFLDDDDDDDGAVGVGSALISFLAGFLCCVFEP